jgi:hypothetical protein
MILILRNADFSANNVGEVEIPIEIDTDAATIMAKYTKSLSNTKKNAFSRLISGLKDAGIFAKIDHLFVPCLAGSVSEAFYDAKNDITHNVSDTSTYGQYSIDNNGLTSEGGKGEYTQYAITLNKTNYSFTIGSIVHCESDKGNYYWAMGATEALAQLQSGATSFGVGIYNNNYITASFTTALVAVNDVVQSMTLNEASYTPSDSNTVVRVNGESATIQSGISTARSVSKTPSFYLAGYVNYTFSGFSINHGSIDLVAICQNLEGVPCENNSNITMAEKFDSLLQTFKAAFYV